METYSVYIKEHLGLLIVYGCVAGD